MHFVLAFVGFLVTLGSANQHQCEVSSWDDFSYTMMEELIAMGKNIFKEIAIGKCLKIQYSDADVKSFKSCFAKSAASELLKKLKYRDFIFISEDVETINKAFVECRMTKQGHTYNGVDIDKKSYITLKTKYLENLSDDSETNALMMKYFKRCTEINIVNGSNSLDHVVANDICMNQQLIDECQTMNKDPGVAMIVTKAIYSLIDKPKCETNVDVMYLTQNYKECLEEANINWTKNVPDKTKKRKFLRRNTRFHIKAAIEFIKAYVLMILQPTNECAMEKGKLFNRTTFEIFGEKERNMVRELEWKNDTERDQVLEIMTTCGAESEDYLVNMEQFDLSDTDERNAAIWKILYWKIKYEKCFMPKFINTCGFNNDITKMLYPVFSPEVTEVLIVDLGKKKGFKTVIRLLSILWSEFSNTLQ